MPAKDTLCCIAHPPARALPPPSCLSSRLHPDPIPTFPRTAETRDLHFEDGFGQFGICNWNGAKDIDGKPTGHGFLVPQNYDPTVDIEGWMDSGRRQGPWLEYNQRNRWDDPEWTLYTYADDCRSQHQFISKEKYYEVCAC